jgi:hypothetical protein
VVQWEVAFRPSRVSPLCLMYSTREIFPRSVLTLITSFVEMAPQTRNQGNHHENENGETRGNPAPNENPKALTTLATQLVDLMKMGTNANRDV